MRNHASADQGAASNNPDNILAQGIALLCASLTQDDSSLAPYTPALRAVHPRVTPTPTTVKFVFLRSGPDSDALLASARERLRQGRCRVVHLPVARAITGRVTNWRPIQ
jgi:hypothetical protein